jgi:hypothetical protein
MFLLSRGGDTAAASTAESARLHQRAPASIAPAPAAPTPIAVTPPNVVDQMDPTPAVERPAPRAKSHRTPSSHKAPVAPRRQAKIDPDGTLDAYR